MANARIKHQWDPHLVFTRWAEQKGVKINAVKPARFHGRGIGVAASEKIAEGEILVTVPISAMLSVDALPESFKTRLEKVQGLTVHSLLAGFLTTDIDDPKSSYETWHATWPTAQDLHDTMPLLWPSEAQALLPPTAKAMLSAQTRRLQTDLAAFRKEISGQVRVQLFMDYWVLVNTRTLYYVTPEPKKEPPPADRIALCPFVDYFNHADVGCRIEFDANGYKVIADRLYDAGEEIHVTYAKRDNDYLLIEYGFILAQNRWDELSLDHLILERLTGFQEEKLREAGYHGNYMVNKEGVCYRTQVAVRMLFLPFEKWLRFVIGEDDGRQDQRSTDELIVALLKAYEEDARGTLTRLRSLPPTLAMPQAVLTVRWTQARNMLAYSIRSLSA